MHIDTVHAVVSQLQVGKSSRNGVTGPVTDDRYLQASQSLVAISAFGTQINEFYDSLQGIEDPEARRLASDGLTALISNLTHGGDPTSSSDFMVAMQSLHEEDTALFQNFFTTAGELNEGGYNLAGYASHFVALEDRDLQRSFVEHTDTVIHDESTDIFAKQATYNEFLDGMNRIFDEGFEEESFNTAMSDYFNGFGEADSLSEKREYAAAFDVGSNASSE